MSHDQERHNDVVLSTLNARYGHASLALRYLYANLGAYRARTSMQEYVINERPIDIAEAILRSQPSIVGFGVYIWNVRQTLEVVEILKRVSPSTYIVLGGPEVSHEIDAQVITQRADYVITGEADLEFAKLVDRILTGKRPLQKVLHATSPEVSTLASPYELYTEEDIAHRAIYVEASRGCPFRCEFCLSSLEQNVRQFDIESFLSDIDSLLDRGVRHLKFIDRTFNLNYRVAKRILSFFLERLRPGLFLHFEMVPDRFPSQLRQLVDKFPVGSLQFEVGLQTFDRDTAKRISRDYNRQAAEDNLRYLRQQTGVHIHADLIVGLPGEDLESFGRGFDNLLALAPHEIQVGILKRLRGTPIVRHDDEHGMVYMATPPYEILSTNAITFADLQRMKRFARLWDLVYNSGNFRESAPLLWASQRPFVAFLGFSDWLRDEIGAFVGINLNRLSQLLFRFLTQVHEQSPSEVGARIRTDYTRTQRRCPGWLLEFPESTPPSRQHAPAGIPKRQQRHLA